MAGVVDALQGILIIMFLMSVGYVLTLRGWFTDEHATLFARVIIRFALPCLMITNLTASFTRDELVALGPGMFVPFTGILISYAIAYLAARILRIPAERRGTFQGLFTFTNTVMVGLPVTIAIFGEESVPFVTLYYISNATIFWTLGVYLIRRGAGAGEPAFSWASVKQVFNPVLVSVIIAVLLIVSGIRLPVFLRSGLRYFADLVTPLSMLYLGISLRNSDFRGMRPDRELFAVLVGRFLVTPGIMLLLIGIIPVPEMMGRVFVVIAATPVMVQVAIVSGVYGEDRRRPAFFLAVTLLIFLLLIPLYMAFL